MAAIQCLGWRVAHIRSPPRLRTFRRRQNKSVSPQTCQLISPSAGRHHRVVPLGHPGHPGAPLPKPELARHVLTARAARRLEVVHALSMVVLPVGDTPTERAPFRSLAITK